MARPLRVLLAGEEAAGAQTLRLLHETGQQVVGVLTGSKGAERSSGPLSSLAEQWGYRLWPARRVRAAAFADEVRAAGVELLLNVHSLYVMHAAVVAAPRIGSFNVHPGPLPEYAGLCAPSWAILHGERSHGVTVHWMDAGIDTGEIAYEARFEIAPEETAFTLSAKGVRAALPLLRALLEAAAADPPSIPRQKQRAVPGCYFGREAPNASRIDWSACAASIERFVRAADYGPFASPWGTPRATLPGVGELEIVKVARTGQKAGAAPGTLGGPVPGGALVACADEWLLVKKLRVGGVAGDPGQLLAAGTLEMR
jgi:UDP-4-amino-4-deoxy-L-arabinose formyltransferase/UDP-glucuronic acid dehydrogenase (UDP-4-keto-hexauronic acid decarboxylating)